MLFFLIVGLAISGMLFFFTLFIHYPAFFTRAHSFRSGICGMRTIEASLLYRLILPTDFKV